eukprot:jgi/Mesvir1/12939/Mv05954-RA.1
MMCHKHLLPVACSCSGHLAWFTTDNERLDILSVAQGEAVWVGARQDEYASAHDQAWNWTIGTPIPSGFWCNNPPGSNQGCFYPSTEPNDLGGSEDCATLFPAYLNDDGCESEWQAVCRFDAPSPYFNITCPPPFVKGNRSGICTYVSDDPVSWAEGQQRCRQAVQEIPGFIDLAWFESDAERLDLLDTTGGGVVVWTAAQQGPPTSEPGAQWTWTSGAPWPLEDVWCGPTQTPPLCARPLAQEPNDFGGVDEACAVLSPTYLNDVVCTRVHRFTCRWAPKSP